jgi:hypothetical protein
LNRQDAKTAKKNNNQNGQDKHAPVGAPPSYLPPHARKEDRQD